MSSILDEQPSQVNDSKEALQAMLGHQRVPSNSLLSQGSLNSSFAARVQQDIPNQGWLE